MRALAQDSAGIDEVAAALGRPVDWLRRNWLNINRRHGFPRKHPTGWTWSRAAVSAWLVAGGVVRPELVPANDAAPLHDDHATAYTAMIEQAYGVQA